jgi:hypothetical protein
MNYICHYASFFGYSGSIGCLVESVYDGIHINSVWLFWILITMIFKQGTCINISMEIMK